MIKLLQRVKWLRVEWLSMVRTIKTEWPSSGLEVVGECPVCGMAQRKVLYTGLTDRVFGSAPGEWTVYECMGCESAYLDPRPTLDTIGAAYDTYYTHQVKERPRVSEMGALHRLRRSVANGYRNWRFGAKERPATSLGVLLIHLLPPAKGRLDRQYRHLPVAPDGARLLDVGCGNGAFLELVCGAGWCATGVDPDPIAVAKARARGLDVRRGGIEAYADEPETFDIITMSHVLEHVHDPRGTLTQARRLLKPGGSLWIDTPNVKSFGHRFFRAAWLGLDPPRHLVVFHWKSITRLLHDVGFARIERLPHHDVYGSWFTGSDAIRDGRDPYSGRVMTVRLRVLTLLASLCARVLPEMTEFITLTAAKPQRRAVS